MITSSTISSGNRVLSYRSLVVIGNMRGAAGFGMGKAPTADKSIEAAFRSTSLPSLQILVYLCLLLSYCYVSNHQYYVGD